MKFLYVENQTFKETSILFSESEVQSHIDHYFQDSHYYFQSAGDRKPLARRTGFLLAIVSTPIAVWAGLSFRQNVIDASDSVDMGLSCVLFGVFLMICLVGWVGVLQSPNTPDEIGSNEKRKDKQKFVAAKGYTRREMAYDHLLENGVVYAGKIAEIIPLTDTVRQISFHFGPKNAIQSGVFVTEAPVELELYDTLVVLSDGKFTVLI